MPRGKGHNIIGLVRTFWWSARTCVTYSGLQMPPPHFQGSLSVAFSNREMHTKDRRQRPEGGPGLAERRHDSALEYESRS